MKKTILITAFLSLLAVFMMTSCEGPDHKDPRSVAEAALKCYVDGDIKGTRGLFNPADKEKLESYDKLISAFEQLKEQWGSTSAKTDRPAFSDYTLKFMRDPYGYDLNDNTTELNVEYSAPGRWIVVKLEKVDGKWYLSSVPH